MLVVVIAVVLTAAVVALAARPLLLAGRAEPEGREPDGRDLEQLEAAIAARRAALRQAECPDCGRPRPRGAERCADCAGGAGQVRP